MSEAWKQLNLEGGGLQSMNARLTQQMRRHRVAYPLCLLFPLGLHRYYLHEPIGGSVFLALSLLAIALALGPGPTWALWPLGLQLALLTYDLFWIDRRIVAYNKALRKRHFLRPGTTPPAHYKGRYTDDTDLDDYLREKESERAGHQPIETGDDNPDDSTTRHTPSFSEQEAMLRELARARRPKQ